MIRLEQAIIVEGRYDKTTLENFIDATIIHTNGFQIFKDTAKCKLIKRLAEEKGIIILTDSDSAGALIRSYIKNITHNTNITNVYIPRISGKEKRKSVPSKEGVLGVEGMSEEIILNSLTRSGVIGSALASPSKQISKTDLFGFGLSGTADAAANRKSFLNFLELPQNLSPNAMLDILNTFYSYEDFEKEVKKWLQDTDKR